MLKMHKRICFLLAAVITTIILSGCGGGGFAFSTLKVSSSNIPQYKASSEVSFEKNKLKMVWTTIKLKKVTEEEAKKVLADYIEKHKDLDYIEVLLKTNDNTVYQAQYYRTEAAVKTNPSTQKINKYPAIVYNKKQK